MIGSCNIARTSGSRCARSRISCSLAPALAEYIAVAQRWSCCSISRAWVPVLGGVESAAEAALQASIDFWYSPIAKKEAALRI